MRQQLGRHPVCNAVATLSAAAGVTAFLTLAAFADEHEDKSYPRIEGTLLVEIENDNTFHSDDPSTEINDLFATIELATGFYITEHLSVQSLKVLEAVLDPTPFEDRFFGDHGIYFEELYVQWENDRVRIFAGKFDAAFGTAWDVTPGIYGVDFAEDYELAERIGGGVAFTFATMVAASNIVTVAGFFADTTIFSESVITNRGRTSFAAGGASSTESIESFSIVLDSEEFADVPGLTTHIGFDHQAAGLGDAGDETAFVIGAILEREIADTVTLTTNGELAHLDNAGGGPNDIIYATLGTLFEFGGGWNIAGAVTIRQIEQPGGMPTRDDVNAQLSGGYEVRDGALAGTTFDVGVAFKDEGGVHTHIFGISITHEFDFEIAP